MLNQAIKLEENKANVPRILVRAKVNDSNSCYYLMRDEDNELFLNIFHSYDVFDDVTFKINVLKMFKKYKNDEKTN